jgi:amino-acid N-acetyltransferase
MSFDGLVIRPAVVSESALIRSWVFREQLDPTSLKWQNFLVAEWHGEIAAIGQIKHFPDCDELGSLITAPHLRGKGIASALIAALEQRSRRPVYLLCHYKMEAYYQRSGFYTIGWKAAPRSLQIKMLLPLLARPFGVRVLIMQKD